MRRLDAAGHWLEAWRAARRRQIYRNAAMEGRQCAGRRRLLARSFSAITHNVARGAIAMAAAAHLARARGAETVAFAAWAAEAAAASDKAAAVADALRRRCGHAALLGWAFVALVEPAERAARRAARILLLASAHCARGHPGQRPNGPHLSGSGNSFCTLGDSDLASGSQCQRCSACVVLGRRLRNS